MDFIYMLARLFLLSLFFLLLPSALAVDVVVNVNVGNTKTIMEYNFIFQEDENYNSFSFEKPKDAKIVLIDITSGEETPYSVAGDYFIFRPEETKNQTLKIVMESILLSTELLTKGTYSSYVNFNIPINSLNYNLVFEDQKINDVGDVFPRDYSISGNKIIWNINEVGVDLLFLVSFENINFNSSSSEDISYYLLLGLLTLPIFLFIILFVFIKKSDGVKVLDKYNEDQKKTANSEFKDFSKITKDQEDETSSDINIMVSTENNSMIDSKEDIETKFEDFIVKFLTGNEQEVVKIIRNFEGISQFDILNHLPSLTKSNLSKIISKLDSKQILKRIKVGKINKIYLGEKLKFSSNLEKEE